MTIGRAYRDSTKRREGKEERQKILGEPSSITGRYSNECHGQFSEEHGAIPAGQSTISPESGNLTIVIGLLGAESARALNSRSSLSIPRRENSPLFLGGYARASSRQNRFCFSSGGRDLAIKEEQADGEGEGRERELDFVSVENAVAVGVFAENPDRYINRL